MLYIGSTQQECLTLKLYSIPKVQHNSVKTQHWWCASHLVCSTLTLSHMTQAFKTLHTNVH